MNVRAISVGVGSTALVYLAFIVLSGLGFDPLGLRWDFALVGQLGDSFGPLNSLMAGIAAVAAIAAYSSQKKELDRLKASAEAEGFSAARRDFESTYFSLLEMFRDVVNEIVYVDWRSENEIGGRRALRIITQNSRLKNVDTRVESFDEIYDLYRDALAHYFRIFYHILKYVDERAPSDTLFYSRLLRATLSNSEMILIGLNCIHGGGKDKLKPLVEKYAMLHNISEKNAKEYGLIDEFKPTAFGNRQMGVTTDPEFR